MDRTQRMLRTAGQASESDEGIISGVAIVFNTPTTLYAGKGWKVTEEISPAACDNALSRGDDVRCLLNHDPNKVIGRTKATTLKLWKEEDGIHFECKADTEIGWHNDLRRQIKRGDINQCSFAFTIDAEETVETEEELHYVITDLHLYDVSVVTYPAYQETTAEARSWEALRPQPPAEVANDNNAPSYEGLELLIETA